MSNWATPLISGGIGAALASVIGAIIQAASRKGESRANAADIITRAGVSIISELRKSAEARSEEFDRIRDALICLTDCGEEVLDDLPPEKRAHLRKCLHQAHQAL